MGNQQEKPMETHKQSPVESNENVQTKRLAAAFQVKDIYFRWIPASFNVCLQCCQSQDMRDVYATLIL